MYCGKKTQLRGQVQTTKGGECRRSGLVRVEEEERRNGYDGPGERVSPSILGTHSIPRLI